MAKSVLHPLGMSSKLLEDSSYLNWKCHVTNLLLQVTYLAPQVCPYCYMQSQDLHRGELKIGLTNNAAYYTRLLFNRRILKDDS